MLFDSEMKEMLCMKKNCYGGILYEVYGTVVDLEKSGLNVEFGGSTPELVENTL